MYLQKIMLLFSLFILIAGKMQGQTSCANFTISGPGSIPANQQASFTLSSSSGSNFSVSWDFGDGESGNGKSVTHTYISAGVYTITATAQVPGRGGFTCEKKTNLSVQSGFILIDIPEEEEIPPGNPFLEGTQGNWKVKRNFVLQSERNQTRQGVNDNLNLRVDGTYKNFYTFWAHSTTAGSAWIKQNDSKWTFKTQINYYNPFGSFALETIDPLDRYSAVTYGYNNTLAVGVGTNSRIREIGFDSFEDYMYGKCANNHFSFQFVNGIEQKLTENASHSGRWSIRVGAGETVTMQKTFVICEPEPRPAVVK